MSVPRGSLNGVVLSVEKGILHSLFVRIVCSEPSQFTVSVEKIKGSEV